MKCNFFCNTYNLKNLVKDKTCFKSQIQHVCIDLILTNKPPCFQNTMAIDIGISDFHKLIITTMRATFQKHKPIIINYRKYNFFNNESFRDELMHEISRYGFRSVDCKTFKLLFMTLLDKHAPRKMRYIRANNSPFMNKSLSKAIMFRSKLRNKYTKFKTEEMHITYKKQRNYCISLLRKTKKDFYENLNPNLITDNKTFWKQVKPFFSEKTPMNRDITLIEGDKIISESSKCAEIMNNFFTNAVNELGIDRNIHVNHAINLNVSVVKAVLMYENHPSILKINELGYLHNNFSFHHISEESIDNVIKNMDSNKAYQRDNIPPKLLKMSSDITAIVLSADLNRCISIGNFPENLKMLTLLPLLKKVIILQKLIIEL